MPVLASEAFKRLKIAAVKNGVTEGYLAKLLIGGLKPECGTLPLDYESKLNGRPVPAKKYDSAYVKKVVSNATKLARLENISRAIALGDAAALGDSKKVKSIRSCNESDQDE